MRSQLVGPQRVRVALAALLAAMVSQAAAQSDTAEISNSKVQIIDGRPKRILVDTVSPSQSEVKILRLNRRCKLGLATNYNLLASPLYGVVCYKDEVAPVEPTTKNAPAGCTGAPQPVSVIYYRPDGPRLGQDVFGYSISVEGRPPAAFASVRVTLIPPPAPSLVQKQNTGSKIQQQLGPIPMCPASI